MISRKPCPAAQPRASQPKNRVNSPAEGMAYALRLLGVRDYSGGEMRRKLLAKGLGAPEAEEAVGALRSRGLIDDGRYARRLASYYTGEKLWGPRRVLQKLLEKGIDRELAGALTREAAQAGSSRERLRKVAGSKLKGKTVEEVSPRDRKRLADHLSRRGFLWDDILEFLGDRGGFAEE